MTDADLPGPWTDHDAWVWYERRRHTGAAMIVVGALVFAIGWSVGATRLNVTEVTAESGTTGFAADPQPGLFASLFAAALGMVVAIHGWHLVKSAYRSRRAAERRNLAAAAVSVTVVGAILAALRDAASDDGGESR